MSMLPERPFLPSVREPNFDEKLVFQLTLLLADINRQLNGVSGGRISAVLALASPPASGLWNVGDEVRNNAPSELGTAGSKYIVRGWQCVTAGEPGTWKEQRFLTGG